MIKLYCRTCSVILTLTPDNDEYYIMQSGFNLRSIINHIDHDLVETRYSRVDEKETSYIGINNMSDTDTTAENGLHPKIVSDANETRPYKRISVDKHLMLITQVVSFRSTCIRHHFGCVISKDGKIVSTGYNGAVKGAVHCIDKGCIRNKLGIESGTIIEVCDAVHAEQNAIIQAGSNAEGGILYVNGTPCITCSKMIVNAGIKKIVIPENDSYPDKEGIKIIRSSGIEVLELNMYDDLYEIMNKILYRLGYDDIHK